MYKICTTGNEDMLDLTCQRTDCSIRNPSQYTACRMSRECKEPSGIEILAINNWVAAQELQLERSGLHGALITCLVCMCMCMCACYVCPFMLVRACMHV